MQARLVKLWPTLRDARANATNATLHVQEADAMLGADVHEGLREALLRDPAALTAPVSTLRDKYELLPAFLAVRGLVKQHIDSFNYLVEQDVRLP
jgi:hypothetical protein